MIRRYDSLVTSDCMMMVCRRHSAARNGRPRISSRLTGPPVVCYGGSMEHVNWSEAVTYSRDEVTSYSYSRKTTLLIADVRIPGIDGFELARQPKLNAPQMMRVITLQVRCRRRQGHWSEIGPILHTSVREISFSDHFERFVSATGATGQIVHHWPHIGAGSHFCAVAMPQSS